MIRSLVLVGAVLTASAASAQSCTRQLQEEWAAVSLNMQQMNQIAARQLAMKEKIDTANLCRAAKDMPAYLKTAKAYFNACDPIGGSYTIPDLEAMLPRFIATAKTICR